MSKIDYARVQTLNEPVFREKERKSRMPVPVTHFGELFHIQHEMPGLHQAIESLLSDTPERIIEFIGSLEGEGASTISREYAYFVSSQIGKRVLIIDMDRHRPSQTAFFDLSPKYGWQDITAGDTEPEVLFDRIEDSNLFVCPSFNNGTLSPEVFDSRLMGDFFARLRNRFDLVVIDSPPLSLSPDGLAVARKADGVVLVVEAERTRWKVAENSKERIFKSGGNVLGFVFNKRRFYIPKRLYRRLI